jgi:hypothetical protein
LLQRDSWAGYLAGTNVSLSRGRPSRAREVLDAGRESLPQVEGGFDAIAIYQALYGDGDHEEAARIAARLEADATRTLLGRTALCAVEQWRLWNGETAHAQVTIDSLSSVPPDSANWSHLGARFCAMIVEAVLAHVTGRSDAPTMLARLDSASATDPAATSHIIVAVANRVVTRLYEDAGNPALALRAALRQYDFAGSLPFLAVRLLDQARLAEQTGDRNAAARALRHYIILRSAAEPSASPALEKARSDLARLSGIEGS